MSNNTNNGSLGEYIADKRDAFNRTLEKNPALSVGLRAAALGSGAAAITAIVKEVRDLLEDRKKKKKAQNPDLSSGTIVITVPKNRKVANARDTLLEETKKHKKEKSSWKQTRNPDGTFASGFELDLAGDCEYDEEEEKIAEDKKKQYDKYVKILDLTAKNTAERIMDQQLANR